MEIKLTSKGLAAANVNKVNEEELCKHLTPRGVAVVKAIRKEKLHREFVKNCVEVKRG